MNFSSITAYLDPANWQQNATSAQFPLPPPPPPPQPHGSGGSAGSIRPGSMTDRARIANIPLPESALKCPRCESTNTKFCYFNNYSLSQPRHFCKTCRRYWTRGGALRNVPVGGGCRRDHRRSKGSSNSKPSATSNDRAAAPAGSSSTISSGNSDILGFGPNFSPLQFMAPLPHHLSEFGDFGLNNYGGISGVSAPMGAGNDHLNFQLGSNVLASSAAVTVAGLSGLDQWRLQQAPQFPISGFGSDSSYPFEQSVIEHSGYGSGQIRPKFSSSITASQTAASVKMEERLQELNFSRQLLGATSGNEQYWGGNAWTDFSSFSSSTSARNP